MGFSLNNIKVKNKLLILYFLCVLVPIVVTNFIFFNDITDNVKKRQMDQNNTSMQKVIADIKRNIEYVVFLSNTIYTDRTMHDNLERNYESYTDFFDVYDSYLRDALPIKILPVYKQISSINIYTDNQTIPNSYGYIYIDDSVRKEEWLKKLDAVTDPVILTSYFQRNSSYMNAIRINKHLSLIRRLNYHFAGKNMHEKILKVDLRLPTLYEILKSAKLEGDLYLVNQENKIIVSTNTDYFREDSEDFKRFDGVSIGKKNSIHEETFDNNIFNGWRVVGVFDTENVFKALSSARGYVIVLALINLIIASGVILLISKSLITRLNIISKHVEKIGGKNFEVVCCEEGKDEIGGLIREFNLMTVKIRELIENEVEYNIQRKNLELERKQAELNALQSQINPHFLFNTLESIRMRSMIKNELETAEIIKYLSKTFRRMLVWDQDLITVRKEVEFVQDYLRIQKYRFDDKISYEIKVENAALEMRIPKMTIQPFIENACVHGIEGLKGKGKVCLTINLNRDYLRVVIEDNGIGICEGKLSEMMSEIKLDGTNGESIGIKNVYNRLKLFYLAGFGFDIESGTNQGTKVYIDIPVEVSKERGILNG